MTIDKNLIIISLVTVIVGGFFALYQWNFSNKLKRAEYINQIIEKLRFDKEMAQTMYKIDYGIPFYNKDFHNGNSELEFAIDKLLSYLSYICYLKRTRNISIKEFNVLHYEIIRVCSSFEIQAYLWNLYHFSKKCNTKCSFEYLTSYGIDNNIFPKDFTDINNSMYPKNLNF
ncbi:MAG: hypothetical protein FWF15_08870 [Oscillospiraceae bacterium]|nr:hypothetical protein [Oscillospiraceae bacterium]